ncbi:MAG: acyl-CoA dehydrogenase family protein, partial [Gammaproteobacteria bacterium]|nr:acyl-CoA dehydrogenase family protein [Gammaproteobacteria bacterium]
MFELPERALRVRDQVDEFFHQRILPNNQRWHDEAVDGAYEPAIERELREEAKSLGLWNMALPRLSDDAPGTRLSNLEFTAVAEVLGRLPWASRVFNCHAPDVPNMELLQLFARPDQQARWLHPLLDGDISSAFAMTEPGVASSDPANLGTSITCDGDEWVINGRKWFSSNASRPDCKFLIVVGVTDPEARRSRQHSLVIVPTETPGFSVKRNLSVFGEYSPTSTHPEIEFNDVRVPASNMLGDAGAGFAIGQARLGPARLHHCMRAIGECEVLLSLMVKRSAERSTFGHRIDSYSSTKEAIALSRI